MARVLIIDDEALVRELLGRILALSNHQIIEALSGEEGFLFLRQAPTDLVIVDLALPGMDGFQVIRNLKANFPDTKILAITGNYTLLPEAREQGAHSTLAKPFGIEEFQEAIEDLLGAETTT